MIIAHDLKLIFIKPKKVGGTSFEIALSKFCGVNDIITPIVPEDEETRQSLGFRGAQNYINPLWYQMVNGVQRKYGQSKGELYNHSKALQIKQICPPAFWDTYLKVSITRNPYDSTISRYYWRGGEQTGLNFEDFVSFNSHMFLDNHEITHINGKSAIDYYIRYDHLKADIKKLEAMVNAKNLYKTFKSLNAKASIRPKKGSSVQEMYAQYPKAKAAIDKVCAKEIADFGYSV